MRAFVIADASKRKAKPIGTIIWQAGPTEERGRFTLEIARRCQEDDLPLSLSFLARNSTKAATPEESEAWVRSRIVPDNRQNIAEVLRANGLSEYDEACLLAACKGRSSDDDFLVYEVDIPERILKRLERSDTTWLRADELIDSVVRRRYGNEIRYEFVHMPSAGHEESKEDAGGSFNQATRAPETAARCIGNQIRDWRKRAGLTQTQLAGKAGITQSVLSRLESGSGNPTLSLLEDLAAALDANLNVSFEQQDAR